MPKISRESIQKFNARMVQKFPNVLDIESSILFCKLCLCNINGTKVFSVQQHFRTLKHQAAQQSALEMPMFETAESRKLIIQPPVVHIKLETFSLDLCTTFLEANIPLETVDNTAIQMFLRKYTKRTLPVEATLRTNYVPALYEKYIQKLQHKAENKQIWLSIAETIDSEQQLVANFVFGLMEEDEKGKSYLLNMARLERANASSLAAFINNSLQILWPDGIRYENVLLVVTDKIPYMITALQSLKVLYPNMIYVNCLLQSYHRMVEYIQVQFNQVNNFISNCEAVFLKSPHRQHIMRSKYHYLKLPSTTDTTATPGTWLKAAIYYRNNFTEINTLLLMLDEDEDVECLKQAKQLIQTTSLENDLIYINQHFESLFESITKLKTRDLNLNESLATIDNIRTNLQASERPDFIDKFDKIINDNAGLQELIEMNNKINLFIKQRTEIDQESLWLYQYAPVVSADVAQLSYAKSLLENDKTLSLRNLKQEKYEFSYT